jgi:hypothetical protein
MPEGFEVTIDDDGMTIKTEAFTLVFSKARMGISSFRYETAGAWHECVNPVSDSPVLFAPHYLCQSIPGGVLFPSGTDLIVERVLPWFVQVIHHGYLRNPAIPDCTDYPLETACSLWSSGRLFIRSKAVNNSGLTRILGEEAYRLNPVVDQHIQPVSDELNELKWFGFYSASGGGSTYDRSHDAISMPALPGLDQYGESGVSNRIFKANTAWLPSENLAHSFMVALSGNLSWGDCSSPEEIEARGEALSADYTKPDPLDGSPHAGRMIVGVLCAGFDPDKGGYRFTVA